MTYEPQTFTAPDGTEMVVLTKADYDALRGLTEDAADNAAADRALAESAARYPAEVVDLLMNGATPVAAWRTYRNLTQQQLADRTGLTQAAIARLERHKDGRMPLGRRDTRIALAKALEIPLAALDPLDN